MQITEVCIRRPVFSTVLTLIIVVLGLVCQSRLPVRRDPKVEKSLISVEAEFHGASPKVVESQITKILEGFFSTIPGAELITSHSSNEKSEILIEFASERTPDGAASDVRDRLSQARSLLPKGIPEPIIRKDSSSSNVGMYIGFTSTKYSIDDLRDYVEKYIKSKFEVVSGVGRASLSGGNVKSIRIFIDPQKLASYGYTPADVLDAIPTQHVQKPCGRLISKDKEYMLIVNGELSKPEEFDEIVLPSRGETQKIVKIKDIGKSHLIPDDTREGSWFNGKECVTLAITKQSTANPIDLSKGIQKIMPDISNMLPSGTKAVIAMDEATEINSSMNNVYQAILESTILVILVVLLFLWSFKASLIPIITIPVSLLGTFSLLYLFDFSINTFTMLAMVLAVGLVVDDAIVVLENVHRHIENGLGKVKASIVGSKEIFFSIIAMTLTLATAYIPIGLTPGTLGRYFKEFALTLSGSVIISGFVALTLSPMMCSKLLESKRKRLKKGEKYVRYAGIYQINALNNIENHYLKALKTAITNKNIVLAIGGLIAILGVFVMNISPSEDKPAEDTGYISFQGNSPVGASYEFMEKNANIVNNIISKTPFIKNRWVTAKTEEISGWIQLEDWNQRNMSSREIAAIIGPKLKHISGVPCSTSAGRSNEDKKSLDFVLQTNQSYEYLEREGQKFLWELQSNYKGIEPPLRSSLLHPQQEYVIDLDRDKASSLGITADDIITTIAYFVRGQKAANVQREAKRDELFIQVEPDLRRTPEDLDKMLIKTRIPSKDTENKMVSVSDLITISERESPMGLNHYNQMLSISVFANIADAYSLGDAIEGITEFKNKNLPETIQLTFSGSTKSYLDESRQIVFVFLLALIFVFLVLAAQFESFIDPFIIMLSVPFSITGAIITLYLIPEGTLNIYSKVGLVTLIGLITKHGILIVDFANSLMEKGKTAAEAIVQASHLRLRPILMTTFAMVIGNVPLAFAFGAGAAARRQIGWAIIGGMTFGTFFTLFIVPIMYLILSKYKSEKSDEYKMLDN